MLPVEKGWGYPTLLISGLINFSLGDSGEHFAITHKELQQNINLLSVNLHFTCDLIIQNVNYQKEIIVVIFGAKYLRMHE